MLRKWIGELRSGRHRQCFGSYSDGEGAVCALGALSLAVGGGVYTPDGLHELVVGWNDGEHLDFREIADRLEAYGVREGIFDIPAALAHAEAEAGVNAALDGLHAVGA